MSTQLAGKDRSQPMEQFTGIVGESGDRLHSNFNHGSNEGGGNAVAGNVSDEEPGAMLVDRQELIEISTTAVMG